jgi:hypothetical protein
MTDEQLIASRQIAMTVLARTFRDDGAEKAQLLKLFPPPGDEWAETVEQVYAEPTDAKPRPGSGYVPRDPGQLRTRIVEAMDNVLDHPVIVGRDGLDLARTLRRYFEAAPDAVLTEVAKYA